VAGSNGHKPQHHLSAKEIVAAHREKMLKPWHSDTLDMDFLIRERTGAEAAQLSDEAARLTADVEKYAGTPDAPEAVEQLRLGLRAAIPILLDPETKEPRFGIDEVEDLLEFPLAVYTELTNAAAAGGTFTKAQAEEDEKNSAAEGETNSSSASPVPAATSTSSPTPIR